MNDECRNYEKCLILYRLYRQFWSDWNSWSTPWSIHYMHQCWYDVLYLTFNKFTNCFQICVVFFLAQCNLFHFVVAIRAENFLPVFESKDDILRMRFDLTWVESNSRNFSFVLTIESWDWELSRESITWPFSTVLIGWRELLNLRARGFCSIFVVFCCWVSVTENERKIRNFTKQIVATRKSTKS